MVVLWDGSEVGIFVILYVDGSNQPILLNFTSIILNLQSKFGIYIGDCSPFRYQMGGFKELDLLFSVFV